MFLRKLFEASVNEVAIIFGRFNPPHKGHRAAWELASKSPMWLVGTNQSTVGPKDPLPFDVKVEAMKTVWPEVDGHIVAETSWLTLASKVYEKHPDATLLCLTDEDWVTKTIQQYNGKEGAHGFYNFKNIEQKPTPRLSSATALRDAVTKGDREAFTQAAGVSAETEVAGKPFFDLVAEYLLPYANAPKKAPAKKKKELATAEENVNERDRDPEDWDEGNTEPPNNFAIYINGKKWKVFPGRGYYADDYRERQQYQQLKDWAAKKSAQSGKKWTVHITGENPTESVEEDAAGVGTITKQNTTKDVNKGTLRKMMKAYHLTDDLDEASFGTEPKRQPRPGSRPARGHVTEMPIELNPADPMNPTIYGHEKANPAELKTRMLRASGQLKDLAARAANASPAEWQSIASHFEELKMNIEQIRHALAELAKVRKKGGVKSRGIDPNIS